MTQTFINEEKKALPYRTKLNLSLDAMRLKETSKYLRLQFKLIKMVVSQLRRIVVSFIYFALREITAQGLLSLSRK